MRLQSSPLNRMPLGAKFRSAAGRGTFWTTFGFMLAYAIRLGSTLILTRLLAPEVFGIMALSLVFMMAIQMFSDLGTVPSIVRSQRGDDPEFLRTAWSIQVVRGAFVCGSLCLIAWPVSQLYSQPILFPLLCVLSLCALIEGFISISAASARRHVRLGRLTAVDLATQIFTVTINVTAAWHLQSPWALVIGSICGSLFRVGFGHLFLPRFHHRFRFEPAALAEIVTFGRWVLVATIFTYLGSKGVEGIMGLLVPVDTLGRIAIALTIAWAMGDLMARVLANVIFPSMSRIWRERPEDLPRTVERVTRIVMLAMLPTFSALVILSQPIADLLYDDRYAAVGGYLALGVMTSGMATLAMPYENIMLTMGQSRIYSVLMFTNSSMRVLGLMIGYWLAGEHGMLAGMATGAVFPFLFTSFWVHRQLRIGYAYEVISLSVFALLAVFIWQGGVLHP